MNDLAQVATEVQPIESKLPILWMAFVGSCGALVPLTWFVAPANAVTIDAEIETWLLVFLAMSSGLHVLTVLLLRQAIAFLSRGRYLNYCLFRWALVEGIAIYGALLAFFGVGIGVTSIFLAVAILMMAAVRPGAADRSAFVAQFR